MITEAIKGKIMTEYDNGNIVFMGLGELLTAPLSDFIKQPIEGILYDLNRTEAVVLTFIEDPKWVNDFAVAKVIRALKSRISELESTQTTTP